MKAGCTDCIKFKRTARELKALLSADVLAVASPRFVLIAILEGLWATTAKNTPRGDIGRFADDDLLEEIGLTVDAGELVALLTRNAWVDAHPVHRLVVHDWREHCPNYIKGNVARHGLGWAKDDVAAPEHVPNDDPNGRSKEPAKDGSKQPAKDVAKDVPQGTSLPFKPSQVKSSPPPPTPSRASAVGDLDTAWAEVEVDLISVGVGTAADVIEGVRERHCQPIDVRRCISHWRAEQPAWTPGGLVFRLKTLLPHQDPADANLWPPPSKAATLAAASAARSRVASAAAARREADSAATAADAAKTSELERRHGQELDRALAATGPDVEQLRELFREAHGEAAERIELQRFRKRRAKGEPIPPSARRPLLDVLAARATNSGQPSMREDAVA
jgi:hypothetical protein